VPIMLFDEKLAHDVARRLLDEGIYVIGFSYPVVPKGQARIRVQLSAAHTTAHIDRAVEAFVAVGREVGLLPSGAR
jgi:glycine C-acetyltransferase